MQTSVKAINYVEMAALTTILILAVNSQYIVMLCYFRYQPDPYPCSCALCPSLLHYFWLPNEYDIYIGMDINLTHNCVLSAHAMSGLKPGFPPHAKFISYG